MLRLLISEEDVVAADIGGCNVVAVDIRGNNQKCYQTTPANPGWPADAFGRQAKCGPANPDLQVWSGVASKRYGLMFM